MIYPECNGCVATPFCKLYSGELVSEHTNWCRAKFRLDKAIGLSQIPSRYKGANLYNFVIDQGNGEAFEQIRSSSENIVELVDQGRNFFIYGGRPGAGKTFAATALLNQFIYRTCMTQRFNFENPLALFVDFTSLMDDLRYNKDDADVEALVNEILAVDLLLLDDIAACKMSDFVREQTFRIVNQRLNKGLSTIVTSNLEIKFLATGEMFGTRIVSRLMADATGIEMMGKDRRRG